MMVKPMNKRAALVSLAVIIIAVILGRSEEPALDHHVMLPLVMRNYSPGQQPPVYPSLINGGFEQGTQPEDDRFCVWWDYFTGGPVWDCDQEQRPPYGWHAMWLKRWPCELASGHYTGAPEYTLTMASTDPVRVFQGAAAAQWHTTWVCLQGGLFQRVATVPSATYRLTAWAQGSLTNCSFDRYGPPLHYDCVTPIAGAQGRLKIGVDISGRARPPVDALWTPWVISYGRYQLAQLTFTAQGPVTTVLLWYDTQYPCHHNDAWFDQVALERVD